MIDLACSSGKYMLSNDTKNILKQASFYVDTHQDPKDSYMHSMSSSIYSGDNAEKYTLYFINAKVAEYKTLMASGYAESAYFSLGEAMHVAMDSTSPLHSGFKKFSLRLFTGDALKASRHLFAEGESVFYSDTENYRADGVKLIRGLLDEANRL
jgi:hypothetical protein